ncbi:MAG TPA: GntR family transcriptional regulator [Terriglobales bacterium]|nr:GntR family transcriptional regulator [Terriglobales bacterium]
MRPAKRTASPVPLYFKVMLRLRDDIFSGAWGYGHRLPGEIELARQLGVSVITVRQALARLCREKLLTREWRKGTFVSWQGPLKKSVQLEVETEDLAPVEAEGTSFRVLNLEDVEPGLELRRDFALPAHERVRKIERVRLARGRPLAYVVSYLPSRIAARVRVKGMKSIPLSHVIESSLQIKLSDVKHIVEARLSDEAVSAHLEIPPGSPVLYVERDHFHKKRLIMRTAGFYRSDLFRYELRLKLKKSGVMVSS